MADEIIQVASQLDICRQLAIYFNLVEKRQKEIHNNG